MRSKCIEGIVFLAEQFLHTEEESLYHVHASANIFFAAMPDSVLFPTLMTNGNAFILFAAWIFFFWKEIDFKVNLIVMVFCANPSVDHIIQTENIDTAQQKVKRGRLSHAHDEAD